MTPLIQALNSSDLSAIGEAARILRASYEDEAAMLGLSEKLAPMHPAFITERQLEAMGKNNRLRISAVYSDNDAMIGVLLARFLPRNVFGIERICVLPEWRGHGCGALLHEYALDLARNAKCTMVSVNIAYENAAVLAWCEKAGYKLSNTLSFPGLPYTIAYLDRPVEL